MDIKTKYDIGDEVWFTTNYRQPVKAKITKIYIDGESQCRYLFDEYVPRLERDLYPSKEELLNSL